MQVSTHICVANMLNSLKLRFFNKFYIYIEATNPKYSSQESNEKIKYAHEGCVIWARKWEIDTTIIGVTMYFTL